ncbi:TniQ family protein [Thalassorhabdomicrobium marinisediminis]|nr:TniQ family protein [Thalassorhabdomicrobium marinisediminis]
MSLWPSLPFDPEETLLSYTDRLAGMHTGRGMARLLRDLGVNTEHFASGRPGAVSAFAQAVGLALDEAQRAAIRVLQRAASFRGEHLSKSFLSPRADRYCPSCLAEDGAIPDRRFRLIWGVRHVSRCDLHSTWLVEAPYKNETNLREALGGEPMASPSTATPEPPEYLKWLRGRVTGGSSSEGSWMAGQTLEHVLAASEMLGGILQHGHKVALTRLTAAQTEEATDIGFSIYSEGPGAIEEALDTIRKSSSATAVQAGPLAYYGKLFDWLDRRSNAVDPGPIRDILRDHIVKHSAVEPGTKVLGAEITERRYHTLYSLSKAVEIERPRLSRLLKKLGEIPQEATEVESGKMVFEVARIVPLIDAFSTAIPLSEVPVYLGASKSQVKRLYRHGTLQPLIPTTGRGSVRRVVFARRHLDDLLARVAELPELGAQNDDFHPISYACQRGAGHFEEIFAEALEGRIMAFRHPGRTGIDAIQVDVKSLMQVNASS